MEFNEKAVDLVFKKVKPAIILFYTASEESL